MHSEVFFSVRGGRPAMGRSLFRKRIGRSRGNRNAHEMFTEARHSASLSLWFAANTP